MKLALATDNRRVADHFGRCPEYTLVEVLKDGLGKREVVQNPGHQPGFLPIFLSSFGVTHIIAGGMGSRAQSLFLEKNIETVTGVSGGIDQVIREFFLGQLRPGESTCQHGPGHTCQRG